jgi:outer membrane lipoprotein
MKAKVFFLMGLLAFVNACAPAISKESLRQVDPEITFQELIKDPDRYQGRVILAGGLIMRTVAQEGETWVEVLQHPLDWRQRPLATDVSYGRFLVWFKGFIDPAIYVGGKKITVLGEVQGKKILPLDQMEYPYPVLLPREHHLWKPETSGGGPYFHIGIGVGGTIR